MGLPLTLRRGPGVPSHPALVCHAALPCVSSAALCVRGPNRRGAGPRLRVPAQPRAPRGDLRPGTPPIGHRPSPRRNEQTSKRVVFCIVFSINAESKNGGWEGVRVGRARDGGPAVRRGAAAGAVPVCRHRRAPRGRRGRACSVWVRRGGLRDKAPWAGRPINGGLPPHRALARSPTSIKPRAGRAPPGAQGRAVRAARLGWRVTVFPPCLQSRFPLCVSVSACLRSARTPVVAG